MTRTNGMPFGADARERLRAAQRADEAITAVRHGRGRQALDEHVAAETVGAVSHDEPVTAG
jgi:hypothetical protein